MRRFRQAVVLLLLSLLGGASPALAALTQVECMPRSATCPMCVHGGEPMHCAGGQTTAVPASAARLVNRAVTDRGIPAANCVCVVSSGIPNAALQTRTSPDRLSASSLPLEAIVWPRADLAALRNGSTIPPDPVALRSRIPVPLRV